MAAADDLDFVVVLRNHLGEWEIGTLTLVPEWGDDGRMRITPESVVDALRDSRVHESED